MNTERQKIFNHVIHFVNFTEIPADSEDVFREIFSNIYDSSYGETKIYSSILVSVLLICSIVGTIANLFFICIFKLIFNKRFHQKIHSKLSKTHHPAELANLLNVGTSCQVIDKRSNNETIAVVKLNNPENETVNLYRDYVQMKNKLTLNSKLKIFYNLIYYLALVDLFTCLFAVPVTIFEIMNNNKLNEFCCKFFEFMRSCGVISSNFLIVLIAIEQYNSLSAIEVNRKKYFYIRLIFSFLVSILLAVMYTLQVSVYQKVENLLFFVGICLKSEQMISCELAYIFNILATSILIIGIMSIAIVYSLLFKKAFQFNRRYSKRKRSEQYILHKAKYNSSVKKSSVDNKGELRILDKEETDENKSCPFYQKPNFRIAVMILVLTFVYYLSIIPWCLTYNGIIEYNPFIHNVFLLKSIINPLIYGLLNPNLRICGVYLLKLFYFSAFKK